MLQKKLKKVRFSLLKVGFNSLFSNLKQYLRSFNAKRHALTEWLLKHFSNNRFEIHIRLEFQFVQDV